MAHARRSHHTQRHRTHTLSIVVAGIVALWVFLYARADPRTHLGAFYGNAIGDWLGVFTFIVATKYFFEIGSGESRTPPKRFHARVMQFLIVHSLTIILAVTGLAWALVYVRSSVDSKSGEVIGNILSDWTQLLGLVVLTKYAKESGSKEGG